MKIPSGVVVPPIIVDTREQLPYTFDEHPTMIQKLDTGDYSLQGFEDDFAVERKELGDFLNCVGQHRERFVRELERGRDLRRLYVVVEATIREIAHELYISKINPNSVFGSVVAWESRNDSIRFLFAGDRELGEKMTRTILFRHYS